MFGYNINITLEHYLSIIMATLTKKQKQIYDYLKKYIRKNGISPTFAEIKKHLRLKALSTISEHIEELVDKGFVIKNGYGARSIEIVNNKKFDLIQIPLLGTIAAGQPIEAIENYGETITLARNEMGVPGQHYALKVKGNSMVDEGIFDGDIVVIRKQENVDDGQTVVAIIDDNEATLKKIFREKKRIKLQPANQAMLPIFRKEVEVRGVVVKIVRNLENGVASRNGLVKHIIKENKTCNHLI
ncbi:MAG: repressor LexA [Candidatus Moranbacteria bacterium CG_4_10_14_3_um_filter_44_15]|nr:MAG: repressor LexA [Candidatus Moranbacteria bacterium CG_4_10_14_3_um_filter_44_15]PJA86087.1 MAG: repressor LexA [Candidatus Moranbacteria bacterium CG_4_9_14_3_um_filter_44_28]